MHLNSELCRGLMFRVASLMVLISNQSRCTSCFPPLPFQRRRAMALSDSSEATHDEFRIAFSWQIIGISLPLHAPFLPPNRIYWSNTLIMLPPFSFSDRQREEKRALRTGTEEVMTRREHITPCMLKVSNSKNNVPIKWGIYPLVRRFYLFLQIQRQAPVQCPCAAAARIQFSSLIDHQTQHCFLFFSLSGTKICCPTLSLTRLWTTEKTYPPKPNSNSKYGEGKWERTMHLICFSQSYS